MSLCIAVATPEGIVVGGESRQTQKVGGINRIATDSATKVFAVTDTVIAASAGWGFLQPQGSSILRSISSLIGEFKPTLQIKADITVQEIVGRLWSYFSSLYEQFIARNPTHAVQPGQVALNFIVAGYDQTPPVGNVFGFDIPSPAAPTVPAKNSVDAPGPVFVGQHDVATRIMAGYDYRIKNLPFFLAANKEAAQNQLTGLTYVVSWNTMTLQDAIDFVIAMIQVTITVQKFTAGPLMQPGDIAGVGGPIDIAAIRPGSKIEWIRRKELQV
jgi:hypothetical protein